MVAGIPAKVSKLILLIVNGLIWLCGLGLLIFGIFILVQNKFSYLSLTDGSLRAIAYLLIALGSFIFIISFSGCCGALRESKCLLGLYMALLVGLIIAMVSLVIFAAVKKNVVEDAVASQFKILIKDYPPPREWNSTKPDPIQEAVDVIQHELLQCCGTNNQSDWKQTRFYKNQTAPFKSVPPSCCRDIYDSDFKTFNDTLYQKCSDAPERLAFTEPCKGKMIEWAKSNYVLFIAVIACIAVIELIGIILAMCVYCSIRETSQYR